MTEHTFIEDELPRPFAHAMAWTQDGRGVEVCVHAQAIYISASGNAADKIIRERHSRTGVKFVKYRCVQCGGYHLRREPTEGSRR